MTIHSEWTRIFHEECPEAFMEVFDHKLFNDVKLGVIDGHLQLMCLNEYMGTWENFIKIMYLLPITKLYQMGCQKVVLCFDSYDNVPVYKHMTQLKRSSGKIVQTFDSSQCLPPRIPENCMRFLMNRNFKLKVLQMVCERIPQLIEIEQHQEFILDYKRVVLYKPLIQNTPGKINSALFPSKYSLHPCPITLPEFEPMGESDVKFVRYVDKFGSALVHAIDGDYMIIALLYYAQKGVFSKNKIFLYRQKQSWGSTSGDTLSDAVKESCFNDKESSSNLKKRKNDDALLHSIDQTKTKIKRGVKPLFAKNHNTLTSTKKCWVDMQLIYLSLLQVYRQSIRTDSIDLSFLNMDHREHLETEIENFNPELHQDSQHMKSLIFLILSAGTDFSRQLPLLGPRRLWENLPCIAHYLLFAMKDGQDQMILDVVWGKIYKIIFSKHVSPHSFKYQFMYSDLLHSTLSKSTKEKFPSEKQLLVTSKNIKWVMEYWQTINGKVETPLNGENGYCKHEVTGKIVFDDVASLEHELSRVT
jgi:hypothetical protein